MKKFHLNFIIVIIIMLILEIFVSAIFLLDFSSRERAEYNLVSISRINSVKEEISLEIKKGINDINSSGTGSVDINTTVPEGYDGIAYIALNDTVLKVKTASDYNEYNISEDEYNAFLNNRFNILSLENLTEEYNTFCFFSKADVQGIIIYFKQAEKIFDADYLYDFENLIIITDNGIVITDIKDLYRGNTLHQLTGNEDDIQNTGSDAVYIDVHGENKLFVFETLETEYNANAFKVAGYVSSAIIDEHINASVNRLIVLIVLFLIIAIIVTLVYLILFLKKYNEFSNVKDKKSTYVVYVNKSGKIIKSNSRFSLEFECFEIFDKICEVGISASKILEEGLPMTVLLFDKEKKERFITFLTILKYNGYKLIGEDDTPLMHEYYDTLKLLSRDENLNIYNRKQFVYDYEKAHETLRNTDGAYVLFELKNTKIYKIMFGNDFYEDIKKKFAEIFSNKFKEYGEFYYFGSESFVLLILGSEKSKKFEENISHYMKELNLPVSIGDNLIKIECIAGIVQLDKNIKIKTIDEINSYASLSVDKATEIKALYNIYEFAKSGYVITQSKKREMVKYIIENNQVEIQYQPQYNLIDKKITSFEALCRINGKYEKNIKVSEFIEVAEQSGFMIRLGEFIFEKAFDFAKEIEYLNASISLNVSPVQLMQEGFVKKFLEKFNNLSLKPGSICLEITETFLMTSFDEVVEKLNILSKRGIKIHLDDFGVAYSSMLYLKKLPISTIKIDKEFVADITQNKFSRVICSKIIDITKELGLDSIAEGVETNEQLECLKELGCKIIQGFLIGTAVPADRAKLMLSEFNIKENK